MKVANLLTLKVYPFTFKETVIVLTDCPGSSRSVQTAQFYRLVSAGTVWSFRTGIFMTSCFCPASRGDNQEET